MEREKMSESFASAAAAPVSELKMFDNFISNMQRAGIPADRGVLVGRLDEVREMLAEVKKIEILREFHGAVAVGKAANSEAELENGIKNLARELKKHEKVRRDLERMEKKIAARLNGPKHAGPSHK